MVILKPKKKFSINLWKKINKDGNTNKILITEINAPRASNTTRLLIKSIFAKNETPIHAAKNEKPLVIIEILERFVAIRAASFRSFPASSSSLNRVVNKIA